MNKPRIAQVLGVEVGEEFTYDFGANQVNRGAFKIGADGKRYYKTGDLWNPCYNEDDLAVIINHPDRIIRKPRWTEQEVEDAKTLCRMWPGGEIEFKRYVDGRCTMVHIQGSLHGCLDLGQVDLFPSLRPGETVTIDEIIGGAE